jgi:transcriptional regulator with PAS, ATPase and Fis domain
VSYSRLAGLLLDYASRILVFAKSDKIVIAATNRDLEAAVANGTFRPDLYYRPNVFPIQVPPLRERQDDVLMLLEYFVHRFAQKMGKHFKKIDKRTVELFRSYPWPGNIRELQNVVEGSVIVCETESFSVDQSWLSRRPSATEPKVQFDFSAKRDLNHVSRSAGYEFDDHSLSPIDSVALTTMRPPKSSQKGQVLDLS